MFPFVIKQEGIVLQQKEPEMKVSIDVRIGDTAKLFKSGKHVTKNTLMF